jgi:hypothetical protein
VDYPHTISNIGGSGASVTITGNSISTSSILARAYTSIQLVPQPTSAPVASPTVAPVVPPAAVPVIPPSAAPVVPLAEAPIVPPTDAPVVAPIAAPVVAPTAASVAPTFSCNDNGIYELGGDCSSCPGDCRANPACCIGGKCDSKTCNCNKWECAEL